MSRRPRVAAPLTDRRRAANAGRSGRGRRAAGLRAILNRRVAMARGSVAKSMVVIALIGGAVLAFDRHHPVTAQTPGAAPLEFPKFKVDPNWPKVPARWTLGIVSSSSIDAQDNVWVLQRPNTLQGDEKAKAAPPVLE